ncbi:MAG: bifunctional transaldolase/phosoglucose isomerase [Desulfomonilaceae bacterium]|nr:bifunctional transaldolase/phosoglucose isomerase [Desulfomonilaceae bacterium]
MTNPLWGIRDLGQSVWYDDLGRDLLRSGELKRMIDEDGITGVTSNPTIFEKAIGKERLYDHDIHGLVDQGLDVHAIYEALVVSDIREAADMLMPTYEAASARDGFVSLEVAPSLAYDTDGTVSEAKRLFETVGRKNLMIKVPATTEGIDAVEELVACGVNVNVTLIFSLEQYNDTAMAFIEGMRRWIGAGGDPGQPASVASFFVSRVDTIVDERLRELAEPRWKTRISELMGRAAIANGRLAYGMYKDIFCGERFADLRSQGVHPQRVLWASTSTKNPNYPDTYYVDALIGPGTVNTMPAATLAAYRDHGKPALRLEGDLDEARQVFRGLVDMGLSVEDIMDQLLENGVKAFAHSFDKLLEGIARKRTRLLRGWGHRSASLGQLQERVNATLTRVDEERMPEALWGGDVSLWSNDPKVRSEIGQRLGWLQIVETMSEETRRIEEFVDEIRSSGFKKAVLLGMGGSSLAAETFVNCMGKAEGYLDLEILDTTVPAALYALERTIDLQETLFIVSSKSGTTIEVMSLYRYFYKKMEDLYGKEAGKRFIAITDPGTNLGKLASEHGFKRIFLNPPDIGGRFSALSYFGLVPAGLIGVDLNRLLMRASQAVEASAATVPSLENAGVWLGVIMAEASSAGRDKLSLIISPGVAALGSWLEQLVAESTGKEGKGILPLADEPAGPPDVYGRDRLFVYLRLDEEGTYDEHVSALEKAGHPVVTLRLHSPYDLGREIFRWEFATAVAGVILGINAFDQPNVQESKDITKKLLDRFKQDGQLPDSDSVSIDDPQLPKVLQEFMQPARNGDYVALNAFVSNTVENRAVLQAMRVVLRAEFKTPITVGFGPRYLHSTGQIHKGGAQTGRYIMITADDPEDVPIPGEPYSFGVLKTAQALGDLEALTNKGRPVLRVHLGNESDLEKLLTAAQVIE